MIDIRFLRSLNSQSIRGSGPRFKHFCAKVRSNFPSLAFVSWERPKLPFCSGKQCGQDAVISKPNPMHFRSTGTKMPVLQPWLDLDYLSQMQTNKANSTNWLDVWAKLLYGFNGLCWWTPSKESSVAGDFCPVGQPQHPPTPPPRTPSHEWSINLHLYGKTSIVIVRKYNMSAAEPRYLLQEAQIYNCNNYKTAVQQRRLESCSYRCGGKLLISLSCI